MRIKNRKSFHCVQDNGGLPGLRTSLKRTANATAAKAISPKKAAGQ